MILDFLMLDILMLDILILDILMLDILILDSLMLDILILDSRYQSPGLKPLEPGVKTPGYVIHPASDILCPVSFVQCLIHCSNFHIDPFSHWHIVSLSKFHVEQLCKTVVDGESVWTSKKLIHIFAIERNAGAFHVEQNEREI